MKRERPKTPAKKGGAPSAAERVRPQRLGFMVGEVKVPADFDRMGEAEIKRLFDGE
jgi:hypothetical protein